MDEKRAVPRHKVFKGATIAFDGAGIDCTVRNLSPIGAGLEVAPHAAVPSSFTLLISADSLIRRCHVRWRNEQRIGVAFN